MFDTLSDRLQGALGDLRKRGTLDEESISRAMREIRLALLEADVNLEVVKDFTGRVRERAMGQDVLKSVTPGQQVVKIVHDELTALMGTGGSRLVYTSKQPTVILLAGLQGSGKTTTAAKLALLLRNDGRQPALVATDLQRPAAIDQLEQLGRELGVPVYSEERRDPVAAVRDGLARAQADGRDTVVLDTAGRLHVDDGMIDELKRIKQDVKPHHILLVVDAMTGQDAVTVAEKFNAAVGIDAVILTKMDGDSRGGAALSVRHVTGRPIAFVGTGEKTDALEPFHPDRLASRILGMGDVLSLVEKAQQTVDQDKAQEMVRKLREDSFSLEDFREQLRQVRQLGPLDQILGMLPFGKALKAGPKELDGEQADLDRFDAIILSMTPGERKNPEVINGSRRQRIARGSGTSVQDVNRLLKQYAQLRKMMKQFKNVEGRMGKMKGLPGFPTLRG